MLSIQTLASAKQAGHYYEKDDYYVGGQELSPSSWWGRGARALGLSGAVDRTAFTKLLEGELPDGTLLPRRPDGRRRPGFDLTFSAPKSVSIVALVEGDERVTRAHEAAVSASLGYLEDHASIARVKGEDDRIRAVATKNLVAACFRHETSRDLDPQLHTHAVVLNTTRAPDGTWRALTNEELLRSKMVGGAVYRAELARGLIELGYTIERTHADGRFEIAGFTKEQLGSFSQRRREIEQALEARGRSSAKAAEVAALDTRDKKRSVDRSKLLEIWRGRAKDLGIDLTRPPPKQSKTRIFDDRAGDRAVASAVEHLAERKSVFFEREVIARALAFGLGKIGIHDIEEAFRRKVRSEDLLPAKNAKDSIGRRYTTWDAIAREKALLAIAKLGRGELEPILDSAHLRRTLKDKSFTRGQCEAIELALSTRDRFVAIQGYAGTGKTTALSRIRSSAEEIGFVVRGFATTAAAAEVLREAGLHSITLAQHLVNNGGAGAWDNSPNNGFDRTLGDGGKGPRPELWILDEASMLGNREALAFLRAAERQDARVVLVGDRAQLPAIEAGKPFALLVDRALETATLDDVKRQQDPALKKAVEATIGRDLDRALQILEPHVEQIASRKERLLAVAEEYLTRPDDRRGRTLVLTASNDDRRELNHLIRAGLEAEGVLRGDHVASEVLVKRDLTKAESKSASSFETGNIVRFGRSYKSLGVEKGEYLEIVDVDSAGNRVQLRRADGRPVVLNPTRATAVEVYRSEERTLLVGDRIRFTRNDKELGRTNGSEAVVLAIDAASGFAVLDRYGKRDVLDLRTEQHWEHAYVRTVYSAQGRTADEAIVHIDTEDRHLVGYESFYVGLSRARSKVEIYTDDASELPAAIRRSLEKEAAIEVVRAPERARAPVVVHAREI